MGASICVVGMGYVGLPLVTAFDEAGHDVVGYDIDEKKIRQLKAGTDPTDDVGSQRIVDSTVEFTTDPTTLERVEYAIVALPTPVDDLENPNLEYVEAGGEIIGTHIQEGTTVVLESTVYPGATREVLQPAIERTSGLTAGEEFFIGYSPERLVPGDDTRGLRNVVKVVSGQTPAVAADLETLYATIVDAGVHKAPSIEAAEASKCIENIQRDLNIALVNELAVACAAFGIDTHAVLEAAGTKWNFHHYRPGLVGGHCIPVDPFFMIYESERNGFSPQLIEKAREVNEYMPAHVAESTLKALSNTHKPFVETTVLLLGLAYKPNVSDIRTSAVGGIVDKLASFNVNTVGFDPRVDPAASQAEFDIDTQDELSFEGIDAVILITPHEELLSIDFPDVAHEMRPDPIIFDVTGALDRERLQTTGHLTYERL